MKRKRKGKKAGGLVKVTGYKRTQGPLPPRDSGGKFRRRGKKPAPGQQSLFP